MPTGIGPKGILRGCRSVSIFSRSSVSKRDHRRLVVGSEAVAVAPLVVPRPPLSRQAIYLPMPVAGARLQFAFLGAPLHPGETGV
jgi:hypothetical protein